MNAGQESSGDAVQSRDRCVKAEAAEPEEAYQVLEAH